MPLARTRAPRTSERLLAFAREAARDHATTTLLSRSPHERTWVRLDGPDGGDAWVIGWPPGTRTGWHDHGGSRGAFVVSSGALEEHAAGVAGGGGGGAREVIRLGAAGPQVRTLGEGEGRVFGARHVHDVVNAGPEYAVSVHVYDPALPLMRTYERRGESLELVTEEGSGGWS